MSDSETQKGDSKASAKGKKKVINFVELAQMAGMKDSALDALHTNDFDSIEALKAMGEDDIKELQLTRGQTCLLRKWRESLIPKSRRSIVVGDSSTSTLSASGPSMTSAITDDEVSTLLSSVAGISTVDMPSNSGKFSATPSCSEQGSVKVPRPYEYVDKEYKKPGDLKTFAELILGAVTICENSMITSCDMEVAISMSRHISFLAQKAAQILRPEMA